MFGKTLQFTKEEPTAKMSVTDVFFPRGRGRYVFFIQPIMTEVHTKVVWMERNPDTGVWSPRGFGEQRGPRAAVIVATARDVERNRLKWQGDVWYDTTLRESLKEYTQQRCLLAVYDVSPVKQTGENTFVYPGPDGKFPPQYEAIKPEPRNKPFVLELGGGTIYDQNGDIVGKSALADLMRAIRDGATVDPFSGEMVEVDLAKNPIMMIVSGEGKGTQRKFSVVTMPSKTITADMTHVYDLRSWPQPVSKQMYEYMCEVGGTWQEVCQKFAYEPLPKLIPISAPSDEPDTAVADDDDGEDLFADNDVW